MSNSGVFTKLYNGLNKAQKKAVDTIDGPVMVVAGPGTGKTTVLTLRIANILLQTDTAPEQIIALTFTESGVVSMRKKLYSIIGADAYRVHIHTFHSFSNEVIGRFPDYFPRIIGSRPATEIDTIRIVEEVLENGTFEKLRPYGDSSYYVRPILSAISHLKRDAVTPDAFSEITKEEKEAFESTPDLYYESGVHVGKMRGKYTRQAKYIEKNEELEVVYREYEDALQRQSLYDFDDMILEVIKKMESDDEFKLVLQEEYQYVLADEHQDANNSQNTLLELLCDFYERPNLFIVGDEKQAIFRFQGASLENFLYFKDRYEDVELIALTHNYRSTQTVLDSAHELIQNNKELDHVPLVSAKSLLEQDIRLSIYPHVHDEYAGLVSNILELQEKGVQLDEIAVLFRDNKEALMIAPYFDRAGITYSVAGDMALFSNEDITKLVTIIRAVSAGNDERLLLEMLSVDFLGVHHIDVYKALEYARKDKKTLLEVLLDKKLLSRANVKDVDTICGVAELFDRFVSKAKNKSLLSVLELIARESGFIDSLLGNSGSVERLKFVDGLYREAENVSKSNEEAKLADFVEYIDMLGAYNIRPTVSSPRTDGVRLMTAHKSKGLEFDYVFISGLVDGVWGGRRSRTLFETTDSRVALSSSTEDDDERRLLYVALTRARQGVYLSYPLQDGDSRDRIASRFIGELKDELIDSVEIEADTKTIEKKYHKRVDTRASVYEKEYVQKRFLERGLSVTGINNYLSCPWKYFYQNIVRIPTPQNKFLIFGTAVHKALRYYFDAHKEGKDISPEDAYKYFVDVLPSYLMSRTDYRELKTKGEKAIIGYLQSAKEGWEKDIHNELRINGIMLPVKYKKENFEVPLTGALDKVVVGDDGLRVVDYKTGKPKSRNDIEGKTKSSNGDYKRQLVFYKLLLDEYRNGKFNMTEGEISFVEPDPKGEYRHEVFEVTSDEVRELKEQAQEVAGEIYTLAFWNKRCDDKDCDFCALRNKTIQK